MRPPIAFSGIVLETPRLEETSTFYVDHFALTPDESAVGGMAFSTVASSKPSLFLKRGDVPRLAELRYAYATAGDLAEARSHLQSQRVAVADRGDGFAIVNPDDVAVAFHVSDDPSRRTTPTAGDRPLFMSHAVVNSQDPDRLVRFFRDLLGFRISDAYEKGLLTFMKCDQPQHHCLGIAPADISGLNHFAMDCGDIDTLMRAVSRMRALGHAPVWGPGRHGPGGNVFCYFEDPTGFVPEYTCDVIQIDDDETWKPGEWRRVPENGNVWLSGGPSPRAAELMSGLGMPGHAAGLARATTE